ncbi:MAG TPA: DUF3572 family protein [Alphaproteobacteria bacterium]|nr:DUF3572 family protein [Alphaproteobacteria bacterium]
MMNAPPRPLHSHQISHQRIGAVSQEAAQALALTALAFLLEDPDRAARFCGASGLAGADLATQLSDAAFLGGVLDFVLEDEALLAELAAAAGLPPETVIGARRRLPGGPIEA